MAKQKAGVEKKPTTDARAKQKTAVKPRTKHINTEYEDLRAAHRAATDRHVTEFKTDMDETGLRRTFGLADQIRIHGNTVTGALNKRLEQMMRAKKYRALLKEYGALKEKLKDLEEDSDEYKAGQKELSQAGRGLKLMQEEYQVAFADIKEEMDRVAAGSSINSIFLLSRCEDINKGMEKVLYGSGNRLHYRKRGDLPVIRAKQPNRGISASLDKEGSLQFRIMTPRGKITFRPVIPEDDRFLQDEAGKLINFMLDPEQNERDAVAMYAKTGVPQDTFRICYCMLKCEEIRGRLRVYVQACIEGRASMKYKKDGSIRHDWGKKGTVGADIGTQSVAAVSAGDVMLKNLGERHESSMEKKEARERRLKRKMDRSRRANNKDNYYPDGRVKPREERKPWKNSKTYGRTRKAYKEQARKDAVARKYANRQLANEIRAMGDTLIAEPKNADKLKKKAKAAKEAVREDGTIKYGSRKRYGKSIQNRCPGQLQAELKKKFDNYYEVPAKYRASQYDHTIDDYVKKKLSDRMFYLGNGVKVQRDLYSAFLLAHPEYDLKNPDRGACIAAFRIFKKKMDAEIMRIRASGHKVCNSGI